MSAVDAVPTSVVRGYVAALMAILGRGLVSLGGADAVAREEIHGFPDGFTFEMKVLPSGPGFRVRKEGDGFVPDRGEERPALSIGFKHLRHAFRVTTLLDDTPRAIADDRLVIDGELALAMRINRVIDRMLRLLLPRAFGTTATTIRLFARMTTPP